MEVNNRNRLWIRGRIGWLFPVVGLALLVALSSAKVISWGLCCGDDAYFASVAKNIAEGPGYGTTAGGQGFQLFDRIITSGPAVILPAAAATWLFGNRYWVPGLTSIACWVLLLLMIFRVLDGSEHDLDFRLAAGVFLATIPLLFPFHFEHWFTLLGEVPATLFALLGFAVLSRFELSRRGVALASFFCGLGLLSKTASAILYAALVLVLAVRVVLMEKRSLRELVRYALISAAAFLSPLLVFELYKLSVFDTPAAYLANLSERMALVRSQGLPALPPAQTRWARALEYDRSVASRFGISVFQISIASVLGAVAIIRSTRLVPARLAMSLLAGIIASCIWFLFFSIGWPRYMAPAVMLFSALLSTVVWVLNGRRALAVGGLVLGAFFWINQSKFSYLLSAGFENGVFRKAPSLVSALALTDFIDARHGSTTFVHQSWASIADLEYYSRYTGIFTSYKGLKPSRFHYVVFNRHLFGVDPAFDRFIAACTEEESSFEPYALLGCAKTGNDGNAH
jgi:hypothetical protein